MGDKNNAAPLAQFAEYLDLIFSLVNEQNFTIEGAEFVRIYAESRDASPIKDLSYKATPNRYFQGITWRMLSK
jgi:hypothetical protein